MNSLFLKKLLINAAVSVLAASVLSACGSSPSISSVKKEAISVQEEMETEDIYAVEHGITQLSFTTTDLSGNKVSSDDYSDAKLILVNFWEPWCGPCIAEMPDLEKLYENYKDQGLLILGAFGSPDMDEDAESIVKDNSITYPILHANTNMRRFATAYYPTSIITDGNGNLLTPKAVIGAQSYEDYESLILSYMNDNDETS